MMSLQEDIHVEYAHPQLIYSQTNRIMEFDIFVPPEKLAFEYQGEQHFSFNFQGGNPSYQQDRDIEKELQCKRYNITLIKIPYWWNRSIDTLRVFFFTMISIHHIHTGNHTPI